jgi:hypothetical protein
MGQTSSYNIYYQIKKTFSSFDKRVNLEYHIIKGKLKESEVKPNKIFLLIFNHKFFTLSGKRKLSRVYIPPRKNIFQS